MNFEDITVYDLADCPYCQGAGMVMHEGGWCCYVECIDCGAQTPMVEYKDEASRIEAELKVVDVWNKGKVANFGRGE